MRRYRNTWINHGRPRDITNPTFANYKHAKREFRKILRRRAYEQEINEFSELNDMVELNRSKFQKKMSRRRTKVGHHQEKLRDGDKIITDEAELLSIWKAHYEDLYTTLQSPLYDENFKTHVENCIAEYSLESPLDCTDDPLDQPFETKHIAEVCLALPNGKSGGSDGLVYEHLK